MMQCTKKIFQKIFFFKKTLFWLENDHCARWLTATKNNNTTFILQIRHLWFTPLACLIFRDQQLGYSKCNVPIGMFWMEIDSLYVWTVSSVLFHFSIYDLFTFKILKYCCTEFLKPNYLSHYFLKNTYCPNGLNDKMMDK